MVNLVLSLTSSFPSRESQFEEDPISTLTPLLDRPPSPPFFDPTTHPLGLEEERDNPDELFNELDDLDTEGFLSLDPLHKWETLSSLCTSPPKGLHPQSSSKSPPLSTGSPQPPSPELNPRADTLKRSHSDRLGNSNSSPLPTFDSSSKTLPSSLSSIRDDLDELLCVERKLSEHERVYHTVTGGLPLVEKSENKSDEEVPTKKDVAQKVDELMENNLAPIQAGERNEDVQGCAEKAVSEIKTEIGNVTEVKVTEARVGKRFLVEKCEQQETNSSSAKEGSQKGVGGPIFQLGEYRARPRPKMQEDKGGGKGEPMSLPEEDLKASGGVKGRERERKGARALRRRPAGRRVTRQQRLARRSSINGHW